jgi:hypothetical protein
VAHLPTDDEVRARAEERGLVPVGAPIDRRLRTRVAAELLDEQQKPKVSPRPDTVLLSRFTYETDAGTIRVDVTLTPPKEGPSDGN